MTTQTIQTNLAEYFGRQATGRQREAQHHPENSIRNLKSAHWLTALSRYVRNLPDDDKRIIALADLGWPLARFLDGGTAAANIGAARAGFFRPSDNVAQPTQDELSLTFDDFCADVHADSIDECEEMAEADMSLVEMRTKEADNAEWTKWERIEETGVTMELEGFLHKLPRLNRSELAEESRQLAEGLNRDCNIHVRQNTLLITNRATGFCVQYRLVE